MAEDGGTRLESVPRQALSLIDSSGELAARQRQSDVPLVGKTLGSNVK